MKSALVIATGALVLFMAADVPVAQAQVPPHTPGTVCFTPNFWCWVQPPGQPGGPCTCPSPYGHARGTLG